MAFEKHSLSGPIPGENYTSDTRNYPWHRPPEYTELDDAIEYISKVMTEERGSEAIITMLEMGMTVSIITDIIITKGIGAGKWSVDLGLILAGPIAHIIVLMARGYDVDYDMGLEDNRYMPTKAFFNEAKKVDKKKAKEAGEEAAEQVDVIKDVASASGGFMGGVEDVGGETGGFA